MQIKDLQLKHFGKFSDKNIHFSDGINLIYGENESGKSTIHTFVKSMLFGMERGRGRAAAKDVYHQYEPWENPNYYAGSLRFLCGNRNFILNRHFDKYSKCAELYCEDDGEELSIENGDLEMLLGGMREKDYENTVAVGQLKAAVDKSLPEELKNYAANFYASGNEDIDFANALAFLKNRKKEIEKDIREAQRKRQGEREKTDMEASYIWRDLRHLENEIDMEKDAWKNEEKKWQQWKQEKDKMEASFGEKSEAKTWRIHPVEIIVMLLTLALPFLLFERPWSLLVVIVVALAEGLYSWNCLKDGKKKKKNTGGIDEEGEQLRQAMNKIKWHQESLQGEYKEKTVQYNNLQEQMAELDEVSVECTELDRKIKSIDMAVERLICLSKELQEGISEKLNRRVSDILCDITGGKYSKVKIDEDMQIYLLSEGRRIMMEQVSRGTIEQIYFALRMAAVEMLYDEEYPVVLDDTFAYYDEKRLQSTLQWLKKNRKQVLIFTCQRREEEVMKACSIEFHKINV